MLVSLYMIGSFGFVLAYSVLKHFDKKGLIKLEKIEIALLKLMSILLLVERNATSQLYNLILLFYAAGDVAIVWNQPLSLIFFQLGHLCFLSSYHLIYYEYFLPALAGLTFVIHYFLIYRNPRLCGKHYEYVLYWLYIYVLHCFLFVPLYHGYIGTIPFIISDISIGFELDVVHSLEYPLYYTSLLYLRNAHIV